MKDIPVESQPEPVGPPSVWQENHGNLLLTFFGLVLLVGAGILAYRQTRFRPPRFPTAEAIVPTNTEKPLAPSESVAITISGAATDRGQMMLAIYQSSEGFNDPEKAVILKTLEIRDGTANWATPSESLPNQMAVTAYHDENGDGELNRNQFGIPTERYGFSRNARGLTGPPDFDEAVLDRPSNGEQVSVYVR